MAKETKRSQARHAQGSKAHDLGARPNSLNGPRTRKKAEASSRKTSKARQHGPSTSKGRPKPSARAETTTGANTSFARAEYDRVREVVVRGATSPEGVPWVEIAAPDGKPSVWVKFDDLSDDAGPAKDRMRRAGLILFKEDLSQALDAARNVPSFPQLPLIERPGWSGPYFAMPSGDVFSPNGVDGAIVLFEPDPHKCSKAGSKAWLSGVGRLAYRQPIVTFALMIAFAGPILSLSRVRENIGFELSGPKGVGKSTLQQFATSVVGPALEPAGCNYWINANTTMNAFEGQMPIHSDMMMVIEEMSVMYAGESDRVRASRIREFVFRMTSGSVKSRYNTATGRPVRFVWLTSTNEPVATLLGGAASDVSDAAADRLIAIPISARRPHGIFQKTLPEGCETGEDAARAMAELISDHYGRSIRKFLRGLVKARGADEQALRARIEGYVLELREAVGVDGNAGSEARVADAFGVVYAAGRLAQEFGALPEELECLSAAVRCHKINRKSVGAERTNVERIQLLAKRKGVVDVDLDDTSDDYARAVAAAPALRLTKLGKRELLITPDALGRAFPNKSALFKDAAVQTIMRHDKDRNTIKAKVTSDGKLQRFHCFTLPGPDDAND